MKKKVIILTGVLIVAVALAALGWHFYSESDKNVIYGLNSEDKFFWADLFFLEDSADFDDVPFGMILANDLLLAEEIAGYYKGLAKVSTPETLVFLIDGENMGSDFIGCDKCKFRTVDGDVLVNKELLEMMEDGNVVTLNDEVFLSEKEFLFHLPLIRHYLPETMVVPIVLDSEIETTDIVKFRNWLSENLGEDDLLVMSMDFSESALEGIADLNDISTQATIRNFDYENVMDLDINFASGLYTFLGVMENRGYAAAELMDQFNLQDFSDEHEEETTSYHFWGFFEGEMKDYSAVTILGFGESVEESELGLSSSWQYDEDYEYKSDLTVAKQMRDIRGEEDSFLMGMDYLVFDLEDGDCVDGEQNNFVVSFCKISEENAGADFMKVLRATSGDLLYLIYEFDGREKDKEVEELAEYYVDNGVDVFVGRGLNEAEISMFDYYKGSLIFYNMGDFLGDSKLAHSLTSKSDGLIVGLAVTPRWYEIYFFPLDVVSGYPKIMDLSERRVFFTEILKEVDLPNGSYEIDGRIGKIKVSR